MNDEHLSVSMVGGPTSCFLGESVFVDFIKEQFFEFSLLRLRF